MNNNKYFFLAFCLTLFSNPVFSFDDILRNRLSNEENMSAQITQTISPEKQVSANDAGIQSQQQKPEVLEQLIVAPSNRPNTTTPEGIVSLISPAEKNSAPSTLTDLINSTPSVSQNGQGGHFQNFSIRGVSRQRIKTLINGVRIESDRRAGVSASFIEPLLIGNAVVWRNPASTFFGSGALGGAVQVATNKFTSPVAMAGHSSAGNENYQVLGVGQHSWSLGIARRDAGNANARDGSELNTHFTQYSATLSAKSEWRGLHFDFFALPAIGRDIGKSNVDFPQRTTNYPEEKHLLVKLGVSSDTGWSGKFYIHPNDLETEVLKRNKSFNTVSNKAFDLGGNWQFENNFADFTGLIGIDYFARRDINIHETSVNLKKHRTTTSNPLADGEENEVGVFGSLSWEWGAAELQAGSRFSYFNQTKANATTRSDTAWSGFVGVIYPFNNGIELSANFATGFRFPSLSERFFNGTTGRGSVKGNPDLKKEQSINIDIDASWVGSSLALASHIFYLNVSDYIERIDVDDDLRTFVNLNNGRILGVELEGDYAINEQLNFTWSGHFLDGKDDQGKPLSDIPSNRLLLGLKYNLDSTNKCNSFFRD